ncbi:MAG TPA: hypothetical protein VKU36_01165 [Candidatus Babeliales bacterium]|nr:hypothetical protein [Candidatus Babeliales bacterium]
MTQLLRNKIGLSIVLISGFLYASEDAQRIKQTKELLNEHYESFEEDVLSERWWINKFNNVFYFGDAAVKKGAKDRGYNEFVRDICIPASYPFFRRPPEEIKQIFMEIRSDDHALDRLGMLINKCSQESDDADLINRVAITTYNEGKMLELEKIKRGQAITDEDKDKWTAMGLFAKYIVVDKKITV